MGVRILRAILIFASCISVLSYFAADGREPDIQSIYDGHHWFALRDAVEHGDASPFFRGAVAAAFNKTKQAQLDLEAVISAAPHSREAYSAHTLLAGLYFRTGRYREALAQEDAMLAEKPNAEDAKNVEPLFRALSRSPNQTVVQKQASTVKTRLKDGNLFVPLTINGSSASYIFDTGFNGSGMSESEAIRLGLEVHEISTKVDSMSGVRVTARIAVANNLTIGEFHLANVAFLIFPDKQPPFDELPDGARGILRISVILALQSIRWTADGTFLVGRSPTAGAIGPANLCFEGAFPVVQVVVRHSVLDFTLDTGAQNTDLYQMFAKEFPDLIESGKKESHELTGVGGSATFDSIVLPSLNLSVGGRDVLLQPAHVLLQKGSGTSDLYSGNLGMDLLTQAHSITLDFQRMTLTLK
jgi:predicted aspartyl protease